MLLCGCGGAVETSTLASTKSASGSSVSSVSSSQPLVGDAAASFAVRGTIDPERWQPGVEAEATMSSVPRTAEQFRAAQQRIGATPQGAVLLQIAAFEMYRFNPAVADQCVAMNNTPTNATSVQRRLRELVVRDDPHYSRPYIAAALLAGATPENGYQPGKPYTAKVRVNPAVGYQQSQMLHGTVLQLQVYSDGYDTHWRAIQVVKPQGSDYYVVSNCPACYTQCKEIAPGATYKGL